MADNGQLALTGLRVVCGLFFVPHMVGKFTQRAAAFSFFRAAGFRPPEVFAFLAIAIEVVLTLMLVLGIEARIAAAAACIYLLIAAGAVIKVEKKWLWHIGGCEYPVFWAVCCGLTALVG